MTSIATAITKKSRTSRNVKLTNTLLRVVFDTVTDKSLTNEKKEKEMSIWITDAGTMKYKCHCKLKLKPEILLPLKNYVEIQYR